MTAGTATRRPAAVVKSASATPAATTDGPAEPVRAMSWNALMMPHTVPRSPIRGAVLPIVPRNPRFRSSSIRCSLNAIWSFSSTASGGRSALRSISDATGPCGHAERIPPIGRRGGPEVRLEGAVRVAQRLPAPAEAVLKLHLEHRGRAGVQRGLELLSRFLHLSRRLVHVSELVRHVGGAGVVRPVRAVALQRYAGFVGLPEELLAEREVVSRRRAHLGRDALLQNTGERDRRARVFLALELEQSEPELHRGPEIALGEEGEELLITEARLVARARLSVGIGQEELGLVRRRVARELAHHAAEPVGGLGVLFPLVVPLRDLELRVGGEGARGVLLDQRLEHFGPLGGLTEAVERKLRAALGFARGGRARELFLYLRKPGEGGRVVSSVVLALREPEGRESRDVGRREMLEQPQVAPLRLDVSLRLEVKISRARPRPLGDRGARAVPHD